MQYQSEIKVYIPPDVTIKNRMNLRTAAGKGTGTGSLLSAYYSYISCTGIRYVLDLESREMKHQVEEIII